MATKAQQQKDQQQTDDDLVRRAVGLLRKAERAHSRRCDLYTSRYRVWTGVLERENDIWESQLAPKYAFQKIDTLLANLVQRAPQGKVKPCYPGASEAAAAQAMEKTLNEFRRRARWSRNQYRHVQQTVVMGISPRKTYFRYENGVERWREEEIPVDSLGDPIVGPDGVPAAGKLVEKSGPVTRWEQPATVIVPVKDFAWDPSASQWEDCAWAASRTWVTMEHLKAMEAANVYRNVSDLAETRTGRKSGDQTADDLLGVDRSGRYEVWEVWERNRLVTIGNGTVLLRDRQAPYWHGELPYDIGTTLPDLYRVDGFSEIELLAELQAALWDFLNQRIDNTRFITNAAMIVAEGTTISENAIYPGGVIMTDGDPNRSVMPWTPNISIIEPALQAERDLKQDMDDISGVTPYVSGAGSQTLDPQTATQISTFQSMATLRLEAKKTQIFESDREQGAQELSLIQQFIRQPVQIRGAQQDDGSYQWTTIDPQSIVKAQLEYDIDETNETLDRQVRRQEAMELFNLGLAAAPVAMQQGDTISVSKMYGKVLEAFDLDPKEFIQQTPANPLAGLLGQAAPGGGVLAGPTGSSGAAPPPPALAGNGAGAAPSLPPGAPLGG